MADTAPQDEQMPYPMEMRDVLVKKIKEQTSSIQASSQKEPPKARARQHRQQRPEGYRHQPSHGHINEDGEDTIFSLRQCLQCNPQDC